MPYENVDQIATPLDTRLEQIQKEIYNLNELLSIVSERIKPILSNNYLVDAEPKNNSRILAKDSECKLLASLDNIEFDLRNVSEKINRIIQHIAI